VDRPQLEAAVRRGIRLMGASVRSVNGDDGALASAVAEHQSNYDVDEQAARVTFRDDLLPESSDFDHIESWAAIEGSPGKFSPHSYVDALRGSGAAILSVSGWLDGAYQHAAVKRFMTVRNPGSHLLLGPWEHGGTLQISPHGDARAAAFDQEGAMIAFFDHHLRGAPAPDWSPVRYFTMGAEVWRGATSWPPEDVREERWQLHPRGLLSRSPVDEVSSERFVLPDGATTGRSSRWRSYVGPHRFIGYPSRKAQTEGLPTWRSEPLARSLEVTGHPIVTLWIAAECSEGDVFVYLDAEGPDGRVHYVTEGLLRVSHRKLYDGEAPYASPAPYRHFHSADAAPMPHGKHQRIVIDLLPVSYEFAPGVRLRVVLAGADRDNFGSPISLGAVELRCGGVEPSCVVLPVR